MKNGQRGNQEGKRPKNTPRTGRESGEAMKVMTSFFFQLFALLWQSSWKCRCDCPCCATRRTGSHARGHNLVTCEVS